MADYVITNTEYMAVSMDEYADLIRADLTLDALLDALLNDAELEWDEKSLKFNNKTVSHVLCALCRHRYFGKVQELKKEREEILHGLNQDGE